MMFRNPRESAPNPAVSEPLRALHPLPVIAWGPLALAYLGVPIVVGVSMSIDVNLALWLLTM